MPGVVWSFTYRSPAAFAELTGSIGSAARDRRRTSRRMCPAVRVERCCSRRSWRQVSGRDR